MSTSRIWPANCHKSIFQAPCPFLLVMDFLTLSLLCIFDCLWFVIKVTSFPQHKKKQKVEFWSFRKYVVIFVCHRHDLLFLSYLSSMVIVWIYYSIFYWLQNMLETLLTHLIFPFGSRLLYFFCQIILFVSSLFYFGSLT